jgi:hypothetical protein
VGFEEGLALRVVGAGDRVVVPLTAVGLDDQALSRPAEVRDQAAAVEGQRDVDVRWLEAGIEDEVEDDVLQLGARGLGVGEDAQEVALAAELGLAARWLV